MTDQHMDESSISAREETQALIEDGSYRPHPSVMRKSPQDLSMNESHVESSLLSIDGLIMNFTEFSLDHRVSMVPNTKSKRAVKARDETVKMPNLTT